MDGSTKETDDEIDDEILRDEIEWRRQHGEPPLPIESAFKRIETRKKRLLKDRLSVEDIGEVAVAAAVSRVKDRKKRPIVGSPMKFTGFLQLDTTKIYGMRNPDNDDNVITLGIKGGKHRVMSKRLTESERKVVAREINRMLGFRVYKDRGYWRVWIGSD